MVLNRMKKCSNLLIIRTVQIKTTQILFVTCQTGPNPEAVQHTSSRPGGGDTGTGVSGNCFSRGGAPLHLCRRKDGARQFIRLCSHLSAYFPCSDPPAPQAVSITSAGCSTTHMRSCIRHGHPRSKAIG